MAARGIDVKEIPFVVNMTLPDSVESYLHRIGRVGRANAMGICFNLVGRFPEKVWYHTCHRKRSNTMNCHNTKLTKDGGCCIWMDETEMMDTICKQLEQEVPVLDNALNLPPSIDLTA